MTDKTIRQIVLECQNEVYSQDLLPNRAVDLMRILASVYGNVLDEMQKKELEYNRILLKELDTQKVAAKAKITAQVSDEYQQFLEAKNTEKLLLKMLSSIKTYIRSKELEMKDAKYQ